MKVLFEPVVSDPVVADTTVRPIGTGPFTAAGSPRSRSRPFWAAIAVPLRGNADGVLAEVPAGNVPVPGRGHRTVRARE